MFDYLAFVYAGIGESSGDAQEDGTNLADECLKKLDAINNKDRFPPKLLILLASPEYLRKQKAAALLKGINRTFASKYENVKLIGSSVGGVFFDRKVYPNGALLICLASKLIDAQIGFGKNARHNPEAAVTQLLTHLKIDPSGQIDPNPLANRVIMTFMPGCYQQDGTSPTYPAPELHRRLYEGVQTRIWLVGGVSSANDRTRKRDGFQFIGEEVLHDSIVAANIVTGVPIGLSLNDSLESTHEILRVTKVAKDKKNILEFNGKRADEQLDLSARNLMLAKLSPTGERTVDIPLALNDGSGAIQMLREFKRDNYFEVFRPGRKIVQTAVKGIKEAKKKVYVKTPIASLLFACKAYNPSDERGLANAEDALSKIEKFLKGKSTQYRPCVGGFFDGEIGVDEIGRSRLTNGGVGYVIFGDELRERTPLYEGVSALARYGHKLLAGPDLTPASIYDTIRNALQIISETGFSGAMLSVKLTNLDRKRGERKRFIIAREVPFIIAREAVGARFTKILAETQREWDGPDILALVARDTQPRFISDSRNDLTCDPKAIKRSGIISQYILPLKRLDDSVFGTLQVDLGDLRHLSPEAFRKTEKARMLDCFAEVFSASINRIVNAVENKIMLELDKALEQSLSATRLLDGIETFFAAAGKAFGVPMGHLRLLRESAADSQQPKKTLVLETGFGACYEAEKHKRRELDADDFSPICLAFRSTEPHVVNDVSSDDAFQAMLKSVESDPELYSELKTTRSYAAVAFKNERGEQLGAVSFGAPQPWFFLRLHRTALQALAERLGFLIEHLKAKIARDFLHAVSPKLTKRNLNDATKIFQNITVDFRKALGAEVASLYLWDEDTRKYVLRAASKWKDDRWIHAAKYDEDSGWIGVTAINDKPLYVPDLRKHYLDKGYEFPYGRYSKYMFGEPLSEYFVVEAIGLPLQIGPDIFGVLTLYRRIQAGQRTGFVTTNIKLLQEGAYNAAGLINAVLWHRADKWEKQEDDRRHRLYEGLSAGDDSSFESRICREVLKSFAAAEVEFYRIDGPGNVINATWIAGYRRSADAKRTDKLSAATGDHKEIINQTFSTKSHRRIYRVVSKRLQLSEDCWEDPAQLRIEGKVNQVCIPLIGDRKYIAALVVHWRIDGEQGFSLETIHNAFHLQILGRILGSAYSKDRIKKRAERSKQAVHTAGLYVFQHAHKLVNAIETLYAMGRSIKSAKDMDSVKTKAKLLESKAEHYIETLDWVFDLGELIQDPAREKLSLQKLVTDCWQGIKASGRSPIDQTAFDIDPEILVVADPKLIREVFINLMNNGVAAMKKKKKQTGIKTRLKVNASVSEDKETVRIVFEDNGVGMTPKQKRNAIRGFKPTGQHFRNIHHKGVGVLISLYLLGVQDGVLEYESERGKGTRAIVTLPNVRR